MARALIVGCGCRGRALGQQLVEEGWQVRGTSRREQGLAAIEAAGIEPALADPNLPGTVLDLVDWKPTRSPELEVQNEIDDVRQMLEAQNEMRRRRGVAEIDEGKLRVEVEEEELERLRRGDPFEA